ncbi:cell polarity factor Rax2 [Schizosaccharomyces octosporus yFS286]|uniref:Cell polarity factor Rax2 n=1 Tax=Schizosaccharomyces octosporus (strain yFS286) TaxID=483514 RepID=S9Q5E6_SCHOY|nr:cell polarity factor Rax2 [Schizosaccharomyces octosporus yFS286]EPX75277.1 cell polarity factor Rax2 [Schizosaccharomyces octosporus yFS286]
MGIINLRFQLHIQFFIFVILYLLCCVSPVLSFDVSFLGPFSGFNYLSQPIFSSNASYQLYKQYKNGSWNPLYFPLPSLNDHCFTTIPNTNKVYVPIFDRSETILTVHELFSNTSHELLSRDNSSISSRLHSIFCNNYSPFLYGLTNASNSSSNITELYRWNLTDDLPTAEYMYSFDGNVYSVSPTATNEISVQGDFTHSTPFMPTRDVQLAKFGFRSLDPLSEKSHSTSLMDMSCYSDTSLYIWDISNSNSVSLNAWTLYQTELYSVRILINKNASSSATSFHLTDPYNDSVLPLTYKTTSGFEKCTMNCPLNSSNEYQDFYFPEGWTSWQVNVHLFNEAPSSDLVAVRGIQFFQKDAIAYFEDSFNQHACHIPGYNSFSKHTGNWELSSKNASMPYWTSQPSTENVSAAFIPNIIYSLNASLELMIPGCRYDDTCSNRHDAVVKVYYTADTSPFETVISQRYLNDQYVKIYSGFLQGSSSSFRPYVEILPSENHSLVAHSLRCQENIWDNNTNGFSVISFSSSNNLMKPNSSLFTLEDLSSSSVNAVRSCSLGLCIGGDFNSKYGKNLLYINSSGVPMSFPGQGMDGSVTDILDYDGVTYVSGLFGSLNDKSQVLNNVAKFNSGAWQPLGFGTNGAVEHIRSTTLFKSGIPVTYVSFLGNFTAIYSIENYAIPVDGYALWDPSSQSWVKNTDLSTYFSGNIQSIGIKNDSCIALGKLKALADHSTNNAMYFSTSKAVNSFVPSYLQYIPPDLHLQSITDYFPNNSMVVVAALNKSVQSNPSSDIYVLNKTGTPSLKRIMESKEIISKITSVADELYISYGDNKDPYLENDHYCVYNTTANTFVNSSHLMKLRGKINSILPSYDTQHSFALFGGNISVIDNDCQGLCHLNIAQKSWQQLHFDYSHGIVNTMVYMDDDYRKVLVGGDFTFANGRREFLMTYDIESRNMLPFLKNNSITGPVQCAATLSSNKSLNTSSFLLYGYNNQSIDSYLIRLDGTGRKDISEGLLLGQSDIKSLNILNANIFPDIPVNGPVIVASGLVTLKDQTKVSSAYLVNNTWSPLLTAVDHNGNVGCVHDVVVQNSPSRAIRKGHPLESNKGVRSTRHIVIISLCLSMGVMFFIMSVASLYETVFSFLKPQSLAISDYANYIKLEDS